jgi:hypothetical protein
MYVNLLTLALADSRPRSLATKRINSRKVVSSRKNVLFARACHPVLKMAGDCSRVMMFVKTVIAALAFGAARVTIVAGGRLVESDGREVEWCLLDDGRSAIVETIRGAEPRTKVVVYLLGKNRHNSSQNRTVTRKYNYQFVEEIDSAMEGRGHHDLFGADNWDFAALGTATIG